MPAISPLRALLYARHLRPELDVLVAPPYDVQTEEERDRRAARHENSIVHLDLPRASSGDDPYASAAERLKRWTADGVLVRDAGPAYYLCEQRFQKPGGGETVRRGFFARLALEPTGTGSIIPHERTFEKPRTDREHLLSATRTHLSAVFLVHRDQGGEVAGFLHRAMAGPTLEQARDDGTLSRVVRLEDRDGIEFLTGRLRDTWAVIADGHHRYESAVAYRDSRRSAGRRDAEHILVFLCSMEDPGLEIYPIHRLVHSLSNFDPDTFLRRLGPRFDLTRVGTADDLAGRVASRSDRPGVFGLVLPQRQFVIAEWKEGAGLDGTGMAETPAPLRRLDVVLLHRLILEDVLEIGPDAQARQANIDYVKDARHVRESVAEGRAQIGIQMNPTRMEQVIEVTRGGFRLPQKSTYFFPKVLTGLLLDPLD